MISKTLAKKSHKLSRRIQTKLKPKLNRLHQLDRKVQEEGTLTRAQVREGKDKTRQGEQERSRVMSLRRDKELRTWR